jgi:Carboxypeptidase regulatory-like domain/TonB dependent receptor-like, beta-barrel
MDGRTLRPRTIMLVVAVLVGRSLSLVGQDTRGQILGRVTDPTGAVMAGVSVRVVNTDTNVESTALTNENGDFVVLYLISGTYRLFIEHLGFKRFVRDGIVLRLADRVALSVTLELGQTTETVEVSGEAPLIESSTASLGQVIDNRGIAELPLKDGNPIMLASLAPGVVNLTTGGWTRPFDNSSPSAVAINGTRSAQNEFTMDGAPNTQRAIVAYIPPSDVVQEFKIQTATFDATVGYTPGATINISLKSGTNNLHGTAYYFHQNPALNANKFFSNQANLPKAVIRLHRWGASGSGPVNIPRLYDGRNRTFWLYGYEGIRSADPEGTFTTAVPTAPMKQGDFSALLQVGPQYQIYDPATIVPAPGGRFSRQPFPGNLIPASRINPTARRIMEFWPEPNLPGTADGSNNWTTPRPEWDHFYSHVVRLDHNLSFKHRVFVRANVNNRDNEYSVRFNRSVGAGFFRRNRGLAFDDVYTFSSRFLMNTRYSYTRFIEGNVPVNQGIDLTSLGFSGRFRSQVEEVNPEGVKFPRIDIGGYGGFGPDTLSWRHNDVHDTAANFTRLVASHSLKFGVGYRAYRENLKSLGQASGFINFGTDWTRGPLDSSPAAPMGQTLASFLLGLPSGGSIDVNDSYAEQSQEWALYIQDDWKVAPRLTVTLGMRYEIESPVTERYNRSTRQFDFSTASPIEDEARANYARDPIPEVPVNQFRVVGGLTFAGVAGNPRSLWSQDDNNIMPRIGLAYEVTPNTVLRTGYGVFFDQLGITRRHVSLTGFNSNTDLVSTLDSGQNFVATLTDPFPQGIARPLGSQLGLMNFVGQGVTFYNPEPVHPYMQRWQFGVQQAIDRDTVFEAAYVGNRGTKLLVNRQLNAIPAQYLSTSPVRDQNTINFLNAAVANPFYPLLPRTALAGTTVPRSQLLRPYPHFTSIVVAQNQGFSWYHSLQTRVERRFSAGFMLLGSWTWSKLMEATSFLNDVDPLPYRVISDQDRAQRLVVSGLWELPFGPGKRWSSMRSRGNHLIGGWQVQAIYQGQSGPPLGFGNAIFTGNLKDIALPKSQRKVERWFNIDAGFDRSSQRQLGNNIITLAPRFSGIRGDGINNWDISLIKHTNLSEAVRMQFRAEFINAFNHSQFAAPNTSPTSTAFGRVTVETQWPRTIQFGLKLVF